MISPTSAAGLQSDVIRQNDPAGQERGSEHSIRRKLSSVWFRGCNLSAVVAPEMFSTPRMITRPNLPVQ
jgi:hypothetical protein